MKIKRLAFLMAAALLIFTTACSKQIDEPKDDPKQEEPKLPDTSSGQDDEDSKPSGEDSEKGYYGTFKVTQLVRTAPVSTFAAGDEAKYIGTILTYDKGQFSWGDQSHSDPVYTETTVAGEDFSNDYKNQLTFKDLGLNESEVVHVSAGADFFGSDFYVKDQDTLIVSMDGAFFEAVRSTGGDSDQPSKEPVERAKLYEGIYFDDDVYRYASGEEEPPEYFYQISIANVTDTSFDFIVYKYYEATDKEEKVLDKNTAVMSEDGTKAVCESGDKTITFTFPDNHNAYPDVTDLEVTGIDFLKGKTFVNNNIPGHEFG
ncbi:hypothetical protein [Anaerolentibacter hominis]|uniref:hypothetical protein n=1 Tax=Anaerolentibacter hominis TaxID=3079009 RepID=UPI0031B83B27